MQSLGSRIDTPNSFVKRSQRAPRPTAWEFKCGQPANQALDFPSLGQTDASRVKAAMRSAQRTSPELIPVAAHATQPAAEAAVESREIPDSWEDLETETVLSAMTATTTAPEAPGLDAPRSFTDHVPFIGMIEGIDTATGLGRGSGHSRFKKNLVNLNKATAKWLKQESAGLINLEDLIGRIRASPAAQHLRNVYGVDFRQEQFVEEVIMRAKGDLPLQRGKSSMEAC